MRTNMGAVLGAVLCLLVMSSCSNTSENSEQKNSIKNGAVKSQNSRVTASTSDAATLIGQPLPLDAFQAGSEISEQLEKLAAQMTESCMRKKGIEYQPVLSVPKRARLINPYYQYFGEVDPDHAAKYGYHATPEIREDIKAIEAEVLKPPPTQAQLECVQKSFDFMGGGAPDPTGLVDSLRARAITETLQSKSYAKMLVNWKKCVKEKDIDPPLTPFDLIPKYGGTPEPSAEEIQVATTDVSCKKSSKFLETWLDQLEAVQTKLIDENSVALDEVKQAAESERKRVLELLQTPAS